MAARTHIPQPLLDEALERIKAGERWEDVGKSLGVGRFALRGCFARAGMMAPRGRLSGKYKTTAVEQARGWNVALASRMAVRPLLRNQ